ncbi:MAG: VLRF1 family aeRF1-type release factor [Rhizomicrobium sp.]
MLDAKDLDTLPQLHAPVLTAYLDTTPANPRNQSRKGPATWVRSEARTLTAAWDPVALRECREQADRLSAFLLEKRAKGSRSLAAFVGPNAWRLLPLDVGVDEELYWGEPAMGQLLWLLDEHQPCGVVVVNRAGAKFYRYRMGEINIDPEHPMQLDTFAWRERSLVMGVGGEHERFERRLQAQYQRFYEGIAAECVRWSQDERLTPLALLGTSDAIEQVRAALPAAFAAHVVSDAVLPSGDTPSEIITRAEPLLQAWKRGREHAEVADLLSRQATPEVITGLDATLAALQQGRARRILAARDLRARLYHCPFCGFADRGPRRECPQCGRLREPQSPCAVLPLLARERGAQVEIVAGAAADQLQRGSEGLAAWLRTSAGIRAIH